MTTNCLRASVAGGAILGAALVYATPAAAAEPRPFRDCAECPEMVVVPPGRFVMGQAGLAGQNLPDDELPLREVRVARPFAIGRYEVTLGEFMEFVEATGRKPGTSCFSWDSAGVATELKGKDWLDPGFAQTARHPVACVTWEDAVAYAQWLSTKTDQRYRLPSEAEWEYAARGGSAHPVPGSVGFERLCEYGNIADITAAGELGDFRSVNGHAVGGGDNRPPVKLDSKFSLFVGEKEVPWRVAPCRDGAGMTSAPAGSYRANGYGLYDMLGNVWEWLGDCWVEGYAGAPTDGSARTGGPCTMRVLRGGAWAMNEDGWRYSDRDRDHPGRRYTVLGFRLVREMGR